MLHSGKDVIRFRKDNALIDPVQETRRLVALLSDSKETSLSSSSSSPLQIPPMLIENQVVELLMHLAMHPRNDGGPMASRLTDAVRSTSLSVELTVQMYHLAIECWIKSNAKDAVKPAHHLLRELLNRGKILLPYGMDGDSINRVNSSFALVVHTLLRMDDEQSLEKADSLITRMRSLYDNVTCGLKPNVTAMNAILNTLCHSNYESSASEAKLLLEKMVKVNENDTNCGTEPNATSFAVVIHHFAKLGDVKEARTILRWMIRLHEEGIISVQPDIFCFNSLLDGLGKVGSQTAAQEIEDVLTEMEGIGGGLRPDRLSYTCCIHAYARLGDAEKAEDILRRMINAYEMGNEDARPDATAFGACVDAWARYVGSINGAERAEALVSLQEELYRGGSGNHMAPTTALYNALINAWARSKENASEEKASRVLQRMETFEVKPDATTFNAMLTTLARSGSGKAAIGKAETILKQMENSHDMTLDVITYNSYLDCVARNGADNATVKVKDTLTRMEKHGIDPNRRTYNTAINLLAKSGDENGARMATSILDKMEVSDDTSIRPDARTYGATINAWSRSSDPKRAEMSLEIYKRMKQPNIVAANTVLSACCFVPIEQRDSAVRIAFDMMNELQQDKADVDADHITFSTMLKVIGTGMSPGADRDAKIKQVFKRCCEDGHASDLVLRTLSKSTSHEFLDELIPSGTTNVNKEWSRNVVKRSWR